ncbi:hypothetical protein BDU57DRAFT_523946 [Ampelomyces quisqualis]|uniref:Uncharacterized protein n=1 Tax=Ampelomyces quisqualis TaxID=50730 RepID=A0A6A5Q949_AMPQU|nr:hypothetical protein BDU57DRAFT_523946 [Ampelomyces quisqualis]
MPALPHTARPEAIPNHRCSTTLSRRSAKPQKLQQSFAHRRQDPVPRPSHTSDLAA